MSGLTVGICVTGRCGKCTCGAHFRIRRRVRIETRERDTDKTARERTADIAIGDRRYEIESDDAYLSKLGDVFEPQMVHLPSTLLTPESIVIDVGANIGCLIRTDESSGWIVSERTATSAGHVTEPSRRRVFR